MPKITSEILAQECARVVTASPAFRLAKGLGRYNFYAGYAACVLYPQMKGEPDTDKQLELLMFCNLSLNMWEEARIHHAATSLSDLIDKYNVIQLPSLDCEQVNGKHPSDDITAAYWLDSENVNPVCQGLPICLWGFKQTKYDISKTEKMLSATFCEVSEDWGEVLDDCYDWMADGEK